MITIKVGGTPLYIPEDTTLVLEQHNNSFDIDNIASDIIWTFDLPGKPNAVALDHAQYVNISNHKRYRCEISFNGVVISNGYLYIQGVTDETTISCGVVLDGLGQDGWGERKLKENDYGADVQISPVTATLDEHRQNWINFLTGSLSVDSIYKFFLFCCERFYKNNEAFGYHQNQWSAIVGHDEDKTFAKYVNRLFYGNTGILTPNWQVMNTSDEVANGLKLFNTPGTDTDKTNGYCFAPAIRLDWLIRETLKNAGYKVSGDFLQNNNIKKLYLQSMNALDGCMSQFGLYDMLLFNEVNGVGTSTATQNFAVNDSTLYSSFVMQDHRMTAEFALLMNTGALQRDQPSTLLESYDEIYAIAFVPISESTPVYPAIRLQKNQSTAISEATEPFIYGSRFVNFNELNSRMGGWIDTITDVAFLGNGRVQFSGMTLPGYDGQEDPQAYQFYMDNPISKSNTSLIQLSSSEGYDRDNLITNGYVRGNVQPYGLENTSGWRSLDANTEYSIRLVKCKVHTVKNRFNLTISGYAQAVSAYTLKYGDYELLRDYTVLDTIPVSGVEPTLNIFSNMMRWKDHVPNVTNGDFIKKICRFFGLSIYINPFHKEVQLSFLNNIFNAGAIDITPYVIGSERITYEPKQYKIKAETVLSEKGTSDDFLLPEVRKRDELQWARLRNGMKTFVENENAYNIATKDDKTKGFIWETSSGNDHTLIIGNDNDDKEEIKADISVPNMKVVDTQGTPKYLCDIETNGNSKLMDDDYTGDFDMILQQYKGLQTISLGLPLIGTFKIETANPTCYDKNGNVSDDYLTLAATGRNSVGEKFLRRFYEFQADRENYRFTAKLPVDVFLKVYQMQMPQTAVGQQEKRWIMVQHRRYIPTTVSYEFGHGNYVLATIECARRHYE